MRLMKAFGLNLKQKSPKKHKDATERKRTETYLDVLEPALVAQIEARFSGRQYLSANRDVKTAKVDALEHYLQHGWQENRAYLPNKNIQEFADYLGGAPNSYCTLLAASRELLNAYFSQKLKISTKDYVWQRSVVQKYMDTALYIRQVGKNLPQNICADHYMLVGSRKKYRPASFFDTDFYAQLNPDVVAAGIDLFYHYCAAGSKEGRFPCEFKNVDDVLALGSSKIAENYIESLFDEKYYLSKYVDVENYSKGPYHHYTHFGLGECRYPNAQLEAAFSVEDLRHLHQLGIQPMFVFLLKTQNLLEGLSEEDRVLLRLSGAGAASGQPGEEEVIALLSEHVDEDFYFSMYPDVKATQLSAVQHYCSSGWKEGKDPSPEFSTVFYMDDNPDVKDAAINPLYHYVVAGKTERRYPRRPGGAKADIIFNLNETSSQKSKWKRMLDKSKMISMEGRNSLKALSGKTILSVSHDAYVENVGGIQLCIGVEELHYVKNATNYLHISPYQPSLQLSEFRDNAASGMHLQCILNGKYLGTIKSGELLNILERTKNVSFEPIIHGLHGHSPEYLLRLFKKLGVTSIDVWGHDYFTICESFTLMRNSTTFCNAPDTESKSCSVCLYGSNRQKHIGRIDNLLSQFDCHMIFPSNAAQKIWTKGMRKRLQANIKSMQTIQHIALKALKPQSSTRVRSGSARPVKICYIGYPSYHKGWNDFEELVRYTVGNANVAFFQIGSRPDENSIYPIQFEHCEVQKDNINAMRDIVARLEIDYLYVPVKWPETFNIVSYEAAAGGAQIITHDIPGNVRDFVQTGRRGIVVKDVFELIKKIQDGQLKAVERRQLYEIAYSNMTGDKTVSK